MLPALWDRVVHEVEQAPLHHLLIVPILYTGGGT